MHVFVYSRLLNSLPLALKKGKYLKLSKESKQVKNRSYSNCKLYILDHHSILASDFNVC